MANAARGRFSSQYGIFATVRTRSRLSRSWMKNWRFAVGHVEALVRAATRCASAPVPAPNQLMPIAFAPGRPKLATGPSTTGSLPLAAGRRPDTDDAARACRNGSIEQGGKLARHEYSVAHGTSRRQERGGPQTEVVSKSCGSPAPCAVRSRTAEKCDETFRPSSACLVLPCHSAYRAF